MQVLNLIIPQVLLLLLSLSLLVYTSKAWVSTAIHTSCNSNKKFQLSRSTSPTPHGIPPMRSTAAIALQQSSSTDEHELAAENADDENKRRWLQMLQPTAAMTTAIMTVAPSIANAAAAAASKPDTKIYSAVVAYGHYLSVLVIVACVIIERFTIRPNMSLQEEKLIAKADICLGITGVILLSTGYIRATDLACGKGWVFYSHEPIFWMKMIAVSIFGAASFFPTTKIIQRSVDQRVGKFTPMSNELAARLVQVLNAELLALFSIPLLATLMSRGVAYADKFPWQVEAAFVPILLVGLGTKYVKEALNWVEDGNFIPIDNIDTTDRYY